jgi:hypothetical protein
MTAVILRAPWTYGNPPPPEQLGERDTVDEAKTEAERIAAAGGLTSLTWREFHGVWDLLSEGRDTAFVVRDLDAT